MNKSSNSMSIAGMVVGIISLLLSFVPCIGMLGGVGAVIGLILSILGYRRAKEENSSSGMAMAGMILSSLALIIGVAWTLLFAKVGTEISNIEPIEYNTCDDVLADMDKTVKEMKALDAKGDDAGFGDFKTIFNAGKRLIEIEKSAEELGCNQDSIFVEKMDVLRKEID